ncbi:hypothetical protein ACFX2K_010064 [Malus domestica]
MLWCLIFPPSLVYHGREANGHEGNVQGGKAVVIVNRMLQKKELPKLSEGFARITCCQRESEVQSAVDAYSGLGPLDTLPSGYFGQKCQQ